MTVASFCRACGKALTEEEKAVQGAIYCTACAPAQEAPKPDPVTVPPPPPPLGGTPYVPPPPGTPSPGLAFLLGLIPGVGAIYNGQYAKGLVHVFVFGFLMSIANSRYNGDLEPLMVLMTVGWYLYMPFEAYHTAQRKAHGEVVDEFSSVFPVSRPGFPIGPVMLILVGVVFLLNNLEILRFSQIMKYWPVSLIILGLWMLYQRLAGADSQAMSPEVNHESH